MSNKSEKQEGALEEVISNIIRDVAELGHDSPEDFLEAMLVTADELREILEVHLRPCTELGLLSDSNGPVAGEVITGVEMVSMSVADLEVLEQAANNGLSYIYERDGDAAGHALASQLADIVNRARS